MIDLLTLKIFREASSEMILWKEIIIVIFTNVASYAKLLILK